MAVDVVSLVIHAQKMLGLIHLHERHTRRAMCFEHYVIDNSSFENIVKHFYTKGANELYNSAKAVL